MKHWLLFGLVALPLAGRAAEPASVRRDVAYGDPAHPEKLDLYSPARDEADPPVPAVVWVHGEAGPEADKAGPRAAAAAAALADAGYVCASIDYRRGAAGSADALLDCKNAVRFLRRHAAEFHLDPARIAVLGEGRGGELALLAGLTAGDPSLEPGQPYPQVPSDVSAIGAFDPAGLPALAKRVFPDAPPIMIVADLAAGSSPESAFARTLAAQGVPCELLQSDRATGRLGREVLAFLNQNLGAAPHGLPVTAPLPTPRMQVNLDAGWRFFAHDHRNGSDVDVDESSWTPVSLPHTWNAQDGQDGGGNYYRGPAWYRRHWQWSDRFKAKQLYLQFDGASQQADVYVNGKKLGSHLGGFARFRLDATEAFHPGDNVIAVRVDNGRLGIPPILGDFTFFGGLYRSVSLIATDPVQISMMDYGSAGVFVDQNSVSAQRADITVRTEVENYEDKSRSVEILTLILDAAGHPVAEAEAKQKMAGGDQITAVQKISIRRPHLWDGAADPYVYTVKVTVRANGTARDSVTQPLGLRFFQVDPARGFLLNGHPLDLHGVTRHQDRLDAGWAIGAADEAEDFALLREMGANAVRVMDYQASDTWYQRLDRSGVIASAEIPVVDVVPGDPAYLESAKQQLRELIRQNYNHPAICFWGIGDSTRDEPPKPEPKAAPAPESMPAMKTPKAAADSKAIPNPPKEAKAARTVPGGKNSGHVIEELALLAKSEDSVRLSAYAASGQEAEPKNWHTDVLGFNRFAGWYSGSIAGLGAHLDGIHERHPHAAIGISAYGAGASVFEHQLPAPEPVVSGRMHPEEYQSQVHEQTWPILAARPYLWGKFVWALCDFASDGRRDGDQPGRSDVGLVTFDRRVRKDAYFFYKANWSREPVVTLTSRRFLIRHRPFTDMKVYSNAPEVELFVNGRSLGRRTAGDHVFRWQNVALLAGENHVAARGQFGALTVSDGCTWIYEPAEAPAPNSTPR
jgi:beta-galactosidase